MLCWRCSDISLRLPVSPCAPLCPPVSPCVSLCLPVSPCMLCWRCTDEMHRDMHRGVPRGHTWRFRAIQVDGPLSGLSRNVVPPSHCPPFILPRLITRFISPPSCLPLSLCTTCAVHSSCDSSLAQCVFLNRQVWFPSSLNSSLSRSWIAAPSFTESLFTPHCTALYSTLGLHVLPSISSVSMSVIEGAASCHRQPCQLEVSEDDALLSS